MKRITYVLIFSNLVLLTSCTVGPNYVRPPVAVPAKYKEARGSSFRKEWKVAEPEDAANRGNWWAVFNDPVLNALEPKVAVANQNVAGAVAAYDQSLALVQEAASNFFPLVTAMVSITRQKQPVLLSNAFVSTLGASPTTGATNTDHLLQLSASWVPDLWGSVRRQVEQNIDTAQSNFAQVAATLLSMQGTLAQDYFQLRALDVDQKILDNTVIADQKALTITQSGYTQGTTALADVAQAQATLKTAQAQALDNGINRAQFEHAIAVLIGEPASTFTIKPKVLTLIPPKIPVEIPSALLERRPDIAHAERQVASANAAIGVAIAAYFPNLTLSSVDGYETFRLQNWISKPSLYWSLGASVAETIIDGGLRIAQTAAARATYYQTVATYRQTVLAAFQNVEDNLVGLRILKSELAVQHQAVLANRTALRLALDQYKAGTIAYTTVIVDQTNTLTAEKAESDIAGRRMVAAVGLIEALGGSWSANFLAGTGELQLSYKPHG